MEQYQIWILLFVTKGANEDRFQEQDIKIQDLSNTVQGQKTEFQAKLNEKDNEIQTLMAKLALAQLKLKKKEENQEVEEEKKVESKERK